MHDMSEQKEVWKWVKGWEGIYKISSHGRLKSFKENPDGYILSIGPYNSRYVHHVLCYGKRQESVWIHRLVAEHFIPNPNNKKYVNHKDMDGHNNKVSNLEWVTASENAQHAVENNPEIIEGMVHYNKFERPKVIEQLTLEGEKIDEFPNGAEASRQTGICKRNILQVANQTEYAPGKTRSQAGGYKWRFKEDED